MREQNSAKENYLNSLVTETTTMKLIRKALEREKLSGISVSSYEGRLLSFFAQLIGAKKVVEIGSLYGYSALWFAQSLPPEGVVHAVEMSKERVEKARSLLKEDSHAEKIKWHCGEAKDILPSLSSEGPFDLVFIDADKESYLEYKDWALKNLKVKGLIVADNSFLFGAVYGEPYDKSSNLSLQNMTRFNEYLSDISKFNFSVIPTFEGLTVAQKL